MSTAAQLASQLCKLFTVRQLEERLADHVAAANRQQAHLASIGGGGEVGRATLRAERKMINATLAALAASR